MNEGVINDLYTRAQGLGYGKSLEEFVTLLHTNDNVLQDNFSYVQEKGYQKGLDEFGALVGRKKKTIRNLYRRMVHWSHPLLRGSMSGPATSVPLLA